jgi:hypothetical protein
MLIVGLRTILLVTAGGAGAVVVMLTNQINSYSNGPWLTENLRVTRGSVKVV